MKMIVAFACLVAVALAAPQQKFQQHHQYTPDTAPGKEVLLVKETPNNNNGLGGYEYAYELSDGQTRQENAHIEVQRGARSEDDTAVHRVSGSFSWVDPADGQTYKISYVADENGFQPQGAHIPTV